MKLRAVPLSRGDLEAYKLRHVCLIEDMDRIQRHTDFNHIERALYLDNYQYTH